MDRVSEGAGPEGLRDYLDGLVERFERPAFLDEDPVSILHAFDDPGDREVIGLYCALLAWGRRDTMLRKLHELCERMRMRPRAFVLGYDDALDGARLEGFGHRTFRPEDARTLTAAISRILREHGSLGNAFRALDDAESPDVGCGIEAFSRLLAESAPGRPARLRKHLARPSTGSACKRFCMYLRWMVRPGPVDTASWEGVSPARLVLPLDVHSGRQARALGLLTRKQDDWKAAIELTEACRNLSPADPARYDFALFGAGAFRVTLDPRFVRQPGARDRQSSARRASSAPTVR